MTEVHIVPGLAHALLISTRKFCDAGCKVMFDDGECRVYFRGELVLVGGRDEATGLWNLPINPTGQTRQATMRFRDPRAPEDSAAEDSLEEDSHYWRSRWSITLVV